MINQQFQGSIHGHVAGRDVVIYGSMSEWSGINAERLLRYRCINQEILKKAQRRRLINFPRAALFAQAVGILGVVVYLLNALLNLPNTGLSALSQAVTLEMIALTASLMVTTNLTSTWVRKINREMNMEMQMAQKAIYGIDVELRRLGYL